MICEYNGGTPVEFCLCGSRHMCPNCEQVSAFDADDRELNSWRYCNCGAEEDNTTEAEREGF